jgi:hypothetical protein
MNQKYESTSASDVLIYEEFLDLENIQGPLHPEKRRMLLRLQTRRNTAMFKDKSASQTPSLKAVSNPVLYKALTNLKPESTVLKHLVKIYYSLWFRTVGFILISLFLIGAPFVDLSTLDPRPGCFIQIPRTLSVAFLYIQAGWFLINVTLGRQT